ncbi:LuxR family transcriptional activator of conjugal transfer of Ti plasmids [Bradyrhizobium sp. USDA 4341]
MSQHACGRPIGDIKKLQSTGIISLQDTRKSNKSLCVMITSREKAFFEYVDAIQVADDEKGIEAAGRLLARGLGFNWFAYLRCDCDETKILTSYPVAWVRRYVEADYQKVDPVVRRAQLDNDIFGWAVTPAGSRKDCRQSCFRNDAMAFGISTGVTVPIKCGFGRIAAFTMASSDESQRAVIEEVALLVRVAAIYFHARCTGIDKIKRLPSDRQLTQRERLCLAWAAQGKTVTDTALLMSIAPRTVSFHLDNARAKLNCLTIAHCVAEAFRHGILV